MSAIFTLLLSVIGCGGGGMSLITLGTAASENVDAGQTVTVTATIINDTGTKGASFNLTGPGTLGTASLTTAAGNSITTLTYTAPSSVSAATTATITATSSNTPSQKAVLTINLAPALSLPTTALPNGQVGVAYGPVALNSSGGTSPLTWALASGALPSGIKLSATAGALSGIPTAYGTFTFSISATDAAATPATVTQSYSLVVLPVIPLVTTASLPTAIAGSAYSQQLTYAGGNTSAPVWALLSGSLPAGLTLNTTAGVISGTPSSSSAGATYTFQVTVTVGSQTSVAQSLSIYVPPLPVVSTNSLATGNIGISYSQTLSYSGGSGSTSVSWAISSGSLPSSSGLSLNTVTGVISGTPTTATTYNFSVTVTVGTQTSSSQALSLTVFSVNVTSSSSATGEIGLPFSFRLTAAGGTPPYTWSLGTGSNPLPTGFTLNTTTGVISATPTTTTGSPFSGIVVQATDSAADTATKSMTISIDAARSGQSSELSGTYAFLINGFDASGNPLATAGSFTADGAGNITNGVMDMNGTGMATPITAASLQAATYSVGADGRGQLTLKTATSSTLFVFSLDALSGGIASGGYLSEFDGSGQTLTGMFALRSITSPTVATLNNGFAFGASGFAAGSTASALTHRSLAGELQFNQTATPASAEYLISSASSITPNVPTTLTLAFAGSGRGTLSWKPATGGNTVDFAVYVVSATQFFLVSTDPTQGTTGINDLFSGQALKQTTTTFAAAILNGTSVVRYQSLGTTTSATQFADSVVGLYTFNGSGTASLTGDENAGGVSKSVVTSGSYTVASNGRVQATLPTGFGGCANCVGYGQVYLYLVGSDQGFLMDFSTEAKAGSFDPQTTGLSNSSLSGSYAMGSLTALGASATEDSAVLTSGGSGSATGTEDLNTSGSLSPDTAFTSTYTVAASGRSTFVPTPGDNSVVYVVSPSRAVLLDLTSGSPIVVEMTHQ